jgi:hypothetical protein
MYTIGSKPTRIQQLIVSEILNKNCYNKELIVVSTPLILLEVISQEDPQY